MTSTELAAKVKDIATSYKTVYVYGAFGQPVTQGLLDAKAKQYPKFYTAAKRAQLAQYVGKGYWGFDCVNLIKGILWGWNADAAKANGGAKYASNGVPDVSADGMIAKCSGVTTDFAHIEVGEVVWMSGHIGVYIGGGLAVECTPAWKNCVQITAVGNIGKQAGYNTRTWKKHGKLPWISYPAASSGASTYTGTLPTLPAKGYLGKGDTGAQVKLLQQYLNWYGGYGLSVDGSYGPATVAAVKRYQQAEGLAADGKFGPASRARAAEVRK